jgi:hypothetical protein
MAIEYGNSNEMKQLLKETSKRLMFDYYDELIDALEARKAFSELNQHGEAPLEFWMAFAQLLADVSGYRVVLQAAKMEPIEDKPEQYKTVGYVEVTVGEPALFIRTAEDCNSSPDRM